MIRDQLITKEDLHQFRHQLLDDLKNLLHTKPQKQKQWLKSSEVRQMLKISPGTLQNLRVNGTLSFTKIGGTIFYNYDDIEAMIENNKVEAWRKTG
ncbi:MAG TPA: helix-turn-helix domain-containing protein [Chitinophagaceae bacterium]|jgi:3-methyladenine DNA glycosylase Tag|nr:helix-turn-helix domain-containing protein [Chitinophagaceae bacterium]